jgi:prepilin-type N-terminal cleavage/methylation domain-containing protein
MKKLQRTHHAFTLIELLIVVAIIAILASMLLPSLGRAKRTAEKAVCINNLKQIQLAYSLYPADYDGRLVINGMGELLPPPENLGNWVMGLMGHRDTSDAANRQSTNTTYLAGHRDALFTPYIRTPRSYKCPSDHSTVTIQRRKFDRVRSYSMDPYLGSYINRFLPLEETGMRWIDRPDLRTGLGRRHYDLESDLAPRIPSNIWVMIDDQEDSIFFPEFRGGYDFGGDWGAGIPASRHNGSGVIGFAEGHVETKKWLDPGTTRVPTGDMQYGGATRTQNNLDTRWLNEKYPPPCCGDL